MREILFRGKRNKNGEWVYGDLIRVYHPVFRNVEIQLRIQVNYSVYAEQYEIDPKTVGQYTGLTDKNGKKIFEGDYVKTKFGRLCCVRNFVSACFCGIDFLPLNTNHKPPTEYDMYRSDNLEIVGNIHDNPEFVGVKI